MDKSANITIDVNLRVEFTPLVVEHRHPQEESMLTLLHDLREGQEKLLRGQERLRKQLMKISDLATLVNTNLDELETSLQEEFREWEEILRDRELTADEETQFNAVIERIAAAKQALDAHTPA